MASLAEERRKRRHDEPDTSDNRRSFQRDRDRVLYSAAWRRLGHVTQVVSPTEGIVFHNRLTHTLEVAQIGRRIAERLLDTEGEGKADLLGGLDPDVVETAALVHDLGHPPYGHAIETELNRLVSEYAEDGYEGNAQSFRIVTKLAVRRVASEGLNLTRASLNAILKYPWLRAREVDDHRHKENGVDGRKKWGVYETEFDDYKWARDMLPTSWEKRCLEAEIMDWADDVAYAIHDVEDFYRAGRIPLERFTEKGEEVRHFAEYVEQKLGEKLSVDREEIQDILVGLYGFGQAARPFVGSRAQRSAVKLSSSDLIADCVKKVSLAQRIDDEQLLVVPPGLRKRVEILKQLTWFYVIDDRAVKTQQHGQRKVVQDLFNAYFDATGSSDRDLRGILPQGDLEDLDDRERREGLLNEKERARMVADIISSMTERQLLLTHRKLTGIELGSITDLI